jgi:hypothetical protein
MPMSIYAVSRGLAAVLLSPAIGKYIDVGDRLRVVRLSIGKLHTETSHGAGSDFSEFCKGL